MDPAAPSSTASFQLRRVTCRGDDHSKVTVSIGKSDSPGLHVTLPPARKGTTGLYEERIRGGVSQAFELAGVFPERMWVSVLSVEFIADGASPAGVGLATTGAVLRCLGREDLTPNPGLVNT
jgi:hypothetical protein